MSRTLNDDTVASHPGGVPLSDRRLKALHPELYSRFLWMKTQNAYSVRAFLHGGASMKLRFAEHLMEGDARAAVVIRTSPLLVAAFTEDIDCVAMLRFPDRLVNEHSLRVGSRLLTVNLYGSLRRNKYQDDLHPGPANSGQFGEFWPLIADFLTDDAAALKATKSGITEDEWRKAETLGREYLERHGLFARDGSPRESGHPATPMDKKAGHSELCRTEEASKGPRYVIRTGVRRIDVQGLDAVRDLIARGEVQLDHKLFHPERKVWIEVGELEGLEAG